MKLICMYFQSNSVPLAPNHNGRNLVAIASLDAQPKNILVMRFNFCKSVKNEQGES